MSRALAHSEPFRRRGTPSLLAIPLELLAVIQNFLDPCDIIALRKTCKHLASTTYSRRVWVDALIRICIAHGVFLPTFPLKGMSQRALEHAATVPFRFDALLRGGNDAVEPLAIRLLRNVREGNDSFRSDFCQVWLVPGGRFLITTDSDEIIYLWDLGFRPDSIVKSVPIASLRLQGLIDFRIKGFLPTSDGLGIVLIIVSVSFSINGDTIHLFMINPLAPKPEFKLIRNFDLPGFDGDLCSVFVSTDRFAVFQSDSKLTVWDFVRNVAQTWKTERRFSKIMNMGDHLILTEEDGDVHICKMPGLHPNNDEKLNDSPLVLPSSPFPHPLGEPWPRHFHQPCSWPQGPSRPPYFTFSGGFEDNIFGYFAASHAMESSSSTSIGNRLQVASVKLDEGTAPTYVTSRICCDTLIQMWTDVDTVSATVMDFPSARQRNGNGASTKLYDGDIEAVDFCPFSGRLCVTDGDEIRVLDYMA